MEVLILASVPNRNDMEDTVAWFLNIDGKFSLKIAYTSLVEGNSKSRNRLFNVIWKAKAPQSLKAFMWLAANDALLTNYA